MAILPTDLHGLAEKVRCALDEGDLETYRSLLAPDAHWGPADDPARGCHNRDQILAWYRAARDGGMQAMVTELVVGTGALLVGLAVRRPGSPDGSTPDGDPEPRWQVLTVTDGRISDICGFDERAEAATRAGIPA